MLLAAVFGPLPVVVGVFFPHFEKNKQKKQTNNVLLFQKDGFSPSVIMFYCSKRRALAQVLEMEARINLHVLQNAQIDF